MILNSGEIHIPARLINKAEVSYLYNVIRNAKCDQIDVFCSMDTLYIGACSQDTHLTALYKIPLKTYEAKQVQISTSQDEVEEFNPLEEDELLDDIKFENEEEFVEDVKPFEPVPVPITPVPHPVPVPVDSQTPAPQPVSAQVDTQQTKAPQSEEVSEEIPASDVGWQPQKLQGSVSLSNQSDLIYICTLSEFLQALLIEDKMTKEVVIIAENNKLHVQGRDYLFTYPIIKGYVTLDYYLNYMKDRKWEKVNTEAVQKVAKAISSTNKDVKVDMFVTLEKDKVYSDNSFLLVSAKSWKLQESYHFTYETVPALVKLPVKATDGEAFVSKTDEMIYLKFNEMYLAWTNNINSMTDNLLDEVDMNAMTPIMTLKESDIKKLKIFEKMIATMQVEVDKVVKFENIETTISKVSQGDNTLFCTVDCLKGVELEVDISSLLTAVGLCGTKEPVIKTDLNLKDSTVILISGMLDVLINVENVKKV